MNIGDKVMCIKNFINTTGDLYYEKYKMYEITNISQSANRFYFMLEIDHKFYFTKQEYSPSPISEYFITLKESRKLKLDKIRQIYY